MKTLITLIALSFIAAHNTRAINPILPKPANAQLKVKTAVQAEIKEQNAKENFYILIFGPAVFMILICLIILSEAEIVKIVDKNNLQIYEKYTYYENIHKSMEQPIYKRKEVIFCTLFFIGLSIYIIFSKTITPVFFPIILFYWFSSCYLLYSFRQKMLRKAVKN